MSAAWAEARFLAALLRSASGGGLLTTDEKELVARSLIPGALVSPDSWKRLLMMLLQYVAASQQRPHLTTDALESIQLDSMATDVPIPDGACEWTEDEAAAFFESGGIDLPQRLAEQELVAAWLCGLCVSPDGVRVDVQLGAATHGQATNAVLILGYGGATLTALRPLVDLYQSRWPDWSIVTTTAIGVESELGHTQLEEVSLSLTGCSKVWVHSISNNGHRLLVQLMQAPRVGEQLRASLAGILYDCGACQKEHLPAPAQIYLQMVALVAMQRGIDAHGVGAAGGSISSLLGPFLEEATARGRLDVSTPDAIFEWQRLHEPPVPVLCLTSAEDSVIPPEGVQSFAQRLRDAAPSRRVCVEMLRGAHARLHATQPREFLRRVEALVTGAGPVADD